MELSKPQRRVLDALLAAGGMRERTEILGNGRGPQSTRKRLDNGSTMRGVHSTALDSLVRLGAVTATTVEEWDTRIDGCEHPVTWKRQSRRVLCVRRCKCRRGYTVEYVPASMRPTDTTPLFGDELPEGVVEFEIVTTA